MGKNKKSWLIIALMILGLGGLAGCNIFSWTHKAGSDTGDVKVLMADADSAFASGDYAKAMEYYDKIVGSEPGNSKARYGYVKAYVKSTGLNIIDFAKNAGNQKTLADLTPGLISKAPARAYYLIDDRTKPYGIEMKKFEDLAIVLVKYLDPVALGKCDGVIDAGDPEVNLNLAFAYLLRGIFLIVDPPDGNSGSIQYNVYYKDDGTYVLWSYATNGELPTTAALSKKADALAALDTAIARLNTAITNSLSKDATSWTDVRNVLRDIRSKIATYSG